MPREAPEENPELLEALAGRNADAVLDDLAAWGAAGRLRPDSMSLQQLALTLAMTLDHGAMMQTAAVAKELRATMAELRVDAASDDDEAFLSSLSDPVVSAPIRDSSRSGAGDVGAGSGEGDGGVGVASDTVAAARSRRRPRG